VVDSNVFPASGPPFGNGNTFPGLYDALGREFFFGVTLDL
jgi:iron complex outermembrane recepter protein